MPAFITTMVEKKLLGDKTKGGFYRRRKDGSVETLDPKTLEYRAAGRRRGDQGDCKALAARSRTRASACASSSPTRARPAQFAWKVLSRSLAYSARRIGEIADDVVAIDDAMKWGYNWELGPFETWDALGFAETVDRMKKDGIALPAVDRQDARERRDELLHGRRTRLRSRPRAST